MIIEGNHEHGRAIAESAKIFFNPACDQVIATVSDGKLLGGVIYQDFTGRSISIHCGSFSPYWFTRDLFWIVFNYPFEQLCVSKLIATVPSSNFKSIAFCLKLGFIEETRVTDIFPDGDLLVLSMRREDCRWLKLKPRGAPDGKK